MIFYVLIRCTRGHNSYWIPNLMYKSSKSSEPEPEMILGQAFCAPLQLNSALITAQWLLIQADHLPFFCPCNLQFVYDWASFGIFGICVSAKPGIMPHLRPARLAPSFGWLGWVGFRMWSLSSAKFGSPLSAIAA